jgi:PKD repeat protein
MRKKRTRGLPAAVLCPVAAAAFLTACDRIPTDFPVPDKNVAPLAFFEVASTTQIRSDTVSVTFDASGSEDDSNVVAYEWDFGDTNVPALLTPAQGGQRPEHEYLLEKKIYTVKLRVKDDDGVFSEPFARNVEVIANRPPIAVFTIKPDPPEGEAPLLVSVDASGSSDPDGDLPLTYRWDFGDGSSVPAGQSSPRYEHAYTKGGTFVLTLVVSDGRNQSGPAVRIVDVR